VASEGARPLATRDIIILVIGLAMLIAGARFLVDSVIALSGLLGIGVGVISLVAVALGTSMPELVVSIRAGLGGNADVSLGNIFGSSVFNILFVVGIPGLFSTLVVDAQTLSVGLPVMVAATILFLISTLSNQIYKYEGAMYVLLYLFFLGKVAKLL
jgi:cation:H+ antiporter